MGRMPRAYGDRGAEATEWGAAMLVVAAMVTMLVGPVLPQSIQDGISSAICRIANLGSAAQCTGQQLKPDKCIVRSSTQGYGLTLDVAVVRLGKDLEFVQVRDSNGAVTVIASNGGTLGAVAGIGEDFEWGVVEAKLGAELSASIRVHAGDSWTFPDQESADRFIDDIRQEGVRDAIDDFGPIGWAGRQIMDLVDPLELPPPTSTRTEVQLKAGVGVSAGVTLGPPSDDQQGGGGDDAGGSRESGDTDGNGQAAADRPGLKLPDKLKPKLEGRAGLEVGGKAIIERNHQDGTTTVTQEVTGSGSANVKYVVGSKGVRGEVRGTLQTTYDANGLLTKVTLTRAVTRDNRTVTTTTELPVTTDAERRAVLAQLSGRSQLDAGRPPVPTELNLTWDDFAPTRAPRPGDSAFQRLLYEHGRTSRVTYAHTANDRKYGGSLALGAQVGASANINSRLATVEDAQYLAAPGPGGRREWQNFEECHA